MASNTSKRGLASASKETKKRVSSAGGKAPHVKRGQHGSDNRMNDNQASDNDRQMNDSK